MFKCFWRIGTQKGRHIWMVQSYYVNFSIFPSLRRTSREHSFLSVLTTSLLICWKNFMSIKDKTSAIDSTIFFRSCSGQWQIATTTSPRWNPKISINSEIQWGENYRPCLPTMLTDSWTFLNTKLYIFSTKGLTHFNSSLSLDPQKLRLSFKNISGKTTWCNLFQSRFSPFSKLLVRK